MLKAINFKEKLKQFTQKALSISLSALLTISTLGINTVYASGLDDAISDINGTGSAIGDTYVGYGGFSVQSNAGYRVYVLDSDGNIVDNAVADILYNGYSANAKMWSTQKGSETNDGKVYEKAADELGMPRAIKDTSDDGWTSNYEEVNDWLLTNSIDENSSNASYIIKNYLGSDVINQMQQRDAEHYFCIEPIFKCGIFLTNGKACNGIFYGTTRNWLQICDKLGIGPGTFLGGPIYEVMTKCMYIKDNYSNLDLYAPTDLEDNSLGQLINYSYGLGMIYSPLLNLDIDTGYKTHTYDYEKHAEIPEKAPETPSEYNKGKTIIKCYEDYNTSKTSDKTLENYKWFGRTHTASIIDIEDEADGNGYTLTDWFTSSSNCDTNNN